MEEGNWSPSSETSVRLRTRLVEAEHCDRFRLKLETRGLGSIAQGHSATFENVNLSDTRGITVQVLRRSWRADGAAGKLS